MARGIGEREKEGLRWKQLLFFCVDDYMGKKACIMPKLALQIE